MSGAIYLMCKTSKLSANVPVSGRSTTNTAAACYLFWFFFQAEDGIRDLTVTGVQTCALPILEEEGIYYYFEHGDGKHTLKLVDSDSGHKKLDGKSSIAYHLPGRSLHGDEEYIQVFRQDQRIQPGLVATRSYDFAKPKADLGVKAQNLQKHESADYEWYDFSGEYIETDNGDHYARVRIDELHSEFELAEAECNVREIAVGKLFSFTNAPRKDQEKDYLIVK